MKIKFLDTQAHSLYSCDKEGITDSVGLSKKPDKNVVTKFH